MTRIVDLDEALERSSSFKATIRLEQELGSVGERLVLPLNDSDDGNMRAAKEAQAFVEALLSAR